MWQQRKRQCDGSDTAQLRRTRGPSFPSLHGRRTVHSVRGPERPTQRRNGQQHWLGPRPVAALPSAPTVSSSIPISDAAIRRGPTSSAATKPRWGRGVSRTAAQRCARRGEPPSSAASHSSQLRPTTAADPSSPAKVNASPTASNDGAHLHRQQQRAGSKQQRPRRHCALVAAHRRHLINGDHHNFGYSSSRCGLSSNGGPSEHHWCSV